MAKEKQTPPPVSPERYDEAYFLSACEGYEEYQRSEGKQLSRRLSEALAVAGIDAGMQVLDVGCGRGEVLWRCAALGARVWGVDYASVAVQMSRQAAQAANAATGQADAKHLPFASRCFDRVLMFDLVEHLHPWELQRALIESHRVLKPDGRLVVHTAPNVWYDRWAYPWVRLVRTAMGQGERYPRNPRALIPANLDVHVNEQSMLSLRRTLRQAGFRPQIWLDSPPQHRHESWVLSALRRVAFGWPPFRWFFQREVFAVAEKDA